MCLQCKSRLLLVSCPAGILLRSQKESVSKAPNVSVSCLNNISRPEQHPQRCTNATWAGWVFQSLALDILQCSTFERAKAPQLRSCLGLPCAPNGLAVHLEKGWLARWRSHQLRSLGNHVFPICFPLIRPVVAAGADGKTGGTGIIPDRNATFTRNTV